MINVELKKKNNVNFNALKEFKKNKKEKKTEKRLQQFFLTSKLIDFNLCHYWNNKGVI